MKDLIANGIQSAEKYYSVQLGFNRELLPLGVKGQNFWLRVNLYTNTEETGQVRLGMGKRKGLDKARTSHLKHWHEALKLVENLRNFLWLTTRTRQ